MGDKATAATACYRQFFTIGVYIFFHSCSVGYLSIREPSIGKKADCFHMPGKNDLKCGSDRSSWHIGKNGLMLNHADYS